MTIVHRCGPCHRGTIVSELGCLLSIDHAASPAGSAPHKTPSIEPRANEPCRSYIVRHLRNAATVSVVSLVWLLYAAPPCFASPILVRLPWSAIAPALSISLFIGFSLTALIEFIVVWVVLWCPPRLWWRVFAVVGLVNLITFPPTQVTWWCFMYEMRPVMTWSDLIVPMVLLEALVVLAEFFLLRWQFQKLWRRGVFEKPLSNGRIICATVVANTASFAMGWVVLFSTASLVSRTWGPSDFLY
jgi:hypothetical protein